MHGPIFFFFFSSPFFVFFYSLADRRLRGSAARLRLCYEIDLKAKCSFSLFLSLARFSRRAFLFTIRSVNSYRSARTYLALLSRPQSCVNPDGRYSRRLGEPCAAYISGRKRNYDCSYSGQTELLYSCGDNFTP